MAIGQNIAGVVDPLMGCLLLTVFSVSINGSQIQSSQVRLVCDIVCSL
jgi:hypothetical protein